MADVLKNPLFDAFASASDNVYIYVCDMAKDLSRWSENAVSYFGLAEEYFYQADKVWLEHVHPDDRAIYIEDISATLSGKQAHHSCQYRARNRYGEYVWLECKGSVIAGSDGGPGIFAGIMTRLDAQNKYDPLTNLLTLFGFYLQTADDGESVYLLLGLDDFRKIISNHGYDFGDRVLVEISRVLKRMAGKDWQIYRFGGDEFMIVMPNVDVQQAQQFFNMVCTEVSEMEPVPGKVVAVSLSGGLTRFPKDGSTKERMINNLEHSLEYAKRNYRGKLVQFSERIAGQQRRALILRDDLRQCIRNNFKGFELYFQPLVHPADQRVIGSEALLRWKGSQIRDSYPDEFIKVLEEDGDIRLVGAWVMRQALRQQKAWAEKCGEFHMSFNVSYQQFMDDDFVEDLISETELLGVDPACMIVELTESCRVEDPVALSRAFGRLKEAGFTIALDDFGTAYSSMELLKSLPADYIKIEHSFVRELDKEGHEIDCVIIKNLIALCRELNCKSVVEGVENEAVDQMVKGMDATYLQGYYYSRPVPRQEFEKLLTGESADC